MSGENIRSRRVAAGISGRAVCAVAGISRAKLSDIEREYVAATIEERQRIGEAIDRIVRAKQRIAKFADEAGLSLTGVRL